MALQIAPKHRQDENLLNDLLASYKFLAEHKEASQVTQLLRRRRNEALFLNVDDPSEDQWRFCPAAQLMFNVPDDGDYQEARAFLLSFRSLLVAAGAFEFRLVDEPDLVLSPAEEELSGLRAAFDGMRASKLLTDVVFRAPENAPGSDGPGEVWAHRAFLVTASEYFHDLFSDGFSESGPASVRDPIIIEMETLEEFRCAALVLGEHQRLFVVQYLTVGTRRSCLHRPHPQHRGSHAPDHSPVSRPPLADGSSISQD